MPDTRHILITVALFDRETGESKAIEKDAIIGLEYSLENVADAVENTLYRIEMEH